jgi:hypothetical protein
MEGGGGGVKGQRARKVRHPNRHLWADSLENVGALTLPNHMGLHGLLQG